MGQEVRGVPEALEVVDDPDGSIGRYLARQRRLRDISLDQLAALTKVPRRSLERLESGAFDREPDGFARAFVRTVALALGLDPDEAVMRLMQEPGAEAEPAGRGIRVMLLRWTAIALAATLVLLVWKLGSAWLASGPPPEDLQLTYRRDAVGDLARERAEPADPEARPASPAP